ncbi:MAG: hypothetical protein COA63_013970 [Methylophaga sp.]|nr:hypothetical protein [Methylophaga sp.]
MKKPYTNEIMGYWVEYDGSISIEPRKLHAHCENTNSLKAELNDGYVVKCFNNMKQARKYVRSLKIDEFLKDN